MIILQILILVISCSACSQNVNDSSILAIIKDSQDFHVNDCLHIKSQIDDIIFYADKTDSLKLEELKRRLTDEEITNRLITVFKEIFTSDELNEMYKDKNIRMRLINEKIYGKIISQSKSEKSNGVQVISQKINKPDNSLDDKLRKAFQDIHTQLQSARENIRSKRHKS